MANTYIVVRTLQHDGKTYKRGDSISAVTPAQAARLMKINAIALPKEADKAMEKEADKK